MHASAAVSAHERHRRPFARALREILVSTYILAAGFLGVLEVVFINVTHATNLALGLTFFRWPMPIPHADNGLGDGLAGGVWPLPMMWRGTMLTVAAAALHARKLTTTEFVFRIHKAAGETYPYSL